MGQAGTEDQIRNLNTLQMSTAQSRMIAAHNRSVIRWRTAPAIKPQRSGDVRIQPPNAANHKTPPRKPPKCPNDPRLPLKIVARELFAQRVSQGVKVADAYLLSGYRGGPRERWELRNAPEVAARIGFLLQSRVEADTIARHRPEKKIADIRLRVIRELERLAFADVRNVVQWDRKPQFSPKGDVVGIADEIVAMPSHLLSASAAAGIRSVTTKSGALKIDMHDKLGALEKLAKAIGLFQDAAPLPPSVTVNHLNIAGNDAVEAVRRVAFLLAAADNQIAVKPTKAEPLTIEATASETAS
jgi:hypothetical protein